MVLDVIRQIAKCRPRVSLATTQFSHRDNKSTGGCWSCLVVCNIPIVCYSVCYINVLISCAFYVLHILCFWGSYFMCFCFLFSSYYTFLLFLRLILCADCLCLFLYVTPQMLFLCVLFCVHIVSVLHSVCYITCWVTVSFSMLHSMCCSHFVC